MYVCRCTPKNRFNAGPFCGLYIDTAAASDEITEAASADNVEIPAIPPANQPACAVAARAVMHQTSSVHTRTRSERVIAHMGTQSYRASQDWRRPKKPE